MTLNFQSGTLSCLPSRPRYTTSPLGCLQKLQFNESQTEIIIFTQPILLPASPISVIGTIIQQSDAEIRAHPPLLLFLPLIIRLVFQSCRIYLLSISLHSQGHQCGFGIITIFAPEACDVCSNWGPGLLLCNSS